MSFKLQLVGPPRLQQYSFCIKLININCIYFFCLISIAVMNALENQRNPVIIDYTFAQSWEMERYTKLVSENDFLLSFSLNNLLKFWLSRVLGKTGPN